MKPHRILVAATSVLFLALAGANAQYSTNFNPAGYTLPAPNDAPFITGSLSAQNGWDTNDANQPDAVGHVSYYSTSANDYWVQFGGLAVSTGDPGPPVVPPAYPSVASSELWKNVSLSDTHNAQFKVKMAITSSDETNPSLDTFHWKFGTAGTPSEEVGTPGTSIVSLDFVPNSGVLQVKYTDSAGSHNSLGGYGMPYDVKYDIIATLTGLQDGQTPHLNVSFQQGANAPTVVINNDLTLSDPTASIATVGAVWDLANTGGFDSQGVGTGYPNYGLNTLQFDNYSVAVPEPSVFALLGLGCLGFVGLRSRKKSQMV